MVSNFRTEMLVERNESEGIILNQIIFKDEEID